MEGKVSRRATVAACRALLIGISIAAWELLVKFRQLDPVIFGSPSETIRRAGPTLTDPSLWLSLRTTLIEAAMGWLAGVIGGVGLALILVERPFAREVVRPVLVALNSVPRLALTPLLVAWLGFGISSKVALVFSLTFLIALFAAEGGFNQIEADHLLLADALGFSKFSRTVRVFLPGAAPAILAAADVCIAYSLTAAVIGEMLAGSEGIGAHLQRAISVFDMPTFYISLATVAIVSVTASGLLRKCVSLYRGGVYARR